MAKAPQGSSAPKITHRGKDNEKHLATSSMRAVDFDGHFGWLHAPLESPLSQPQRDGDSNGNNNGHSNGSGIVLCAPLGHEALWLHQAMRSLCERLAARGFAVLRFDYLGAGDSIDTGSLVEPSRWADEAIAAAAFLRRASGVERVSLIGIRFGATVAAQAAQAVGAASVALIAPVVAGRQYIRELGALQRTWLDTVADPVRADVVPDDALDVMGHRFSRAALDTVGTLDLRRAAEPPAARVLIVHAGSQGPSHELADAYAKLGADVASLPFPEYAQALQPSWQSVLPHAMLCAVDEWFADGVSSGDSVGDSIAPGSGAAARAASDEPVGGFPPRRPSDARGVSGMSGTSGTTGGGAVETPVELADGRLFGILCEPHDREHAPLVVIPNTATTHHVGDGRFNVELARSLARAGLASVRIDAHGIGDSPRAPLVTDQSSLAYGQLVEDTSLAVDWAVARGHPRVGLFGICSGAYMSLEVARRNAAVRAILLVNLQRFDFPDQFRMCDAERIGKGSTRAHMRAMFLPRKWAAVLRGEVGLRPVARTLWRYAFDALASNVGALAGDAFGRAVNPGARARLRIKELDARGVHVRMLFSPLDRGLDEFRLHFGPGGRRLNKLKHASMSVIPNMDHEVLNHPARQRVAALGETFFHQAFAHSNASDAARDDDALIDAGGSFDPA